MSYRQRFEKYGAAIVLYFHLNTNHSKTVTVILGLRNLNTASQLDILFCGIAPILASMVSIKSVFQRK